MGLYPAVQMVVMLFCKWMTAIIIKMSRFHLAGII